MDALAELISSRDEHLIMLLVEICGRRSGCKFSHQVDDSGTITVKRTEPIPASKSGAIPAVLREVILMGLSLRQLDLIESGKENCCSFDDDNRRKCHLLDDRLRRICGLDALHD